ncbi:hypothetical protein [Kribbella sp. CA-293567]|uniref:hypothetical protein n=1 Tax=Kribbella sp. CA-293567 TaxID=3002436 RepID=UPI0022DE7CBD|nr:hypothetical protein [Kribbella sp. CA-293567]WBQ08435.1 hypothetical protein OX958_16845 [Kribbella sp. CA-293567]
MPEIYQAFSGMDMSSQALRGVSTDRTMMAEDELRAASNLASGEWMDSASDQHFAVTHQEVNGTLEAADHAQRQSTAWNQCSADGASTLATCRGIAASL